MGKNPRNGDPIDRLLQERQQFAVWLARLDAPSDAPESVRGKVRTDYQARLDAVIVELRSHVPGLVEQLDRQRDSREELLTREAQAKEIMSEAEVRHAVGEYGDARWEQIRGDAEKNLVAIRIDLSQVNEEIAELEKVQAMISAPAIVEPPPPPPAPAVQPVPVEPPVETHFTPPAPEPVQPPVQSSPPAQPAVPVTQSTAPAESIQSPEPPKPTPTPTPPGAGQTTARPAATVRPVKPKEGAPGTPGRTLWFPSVKEEEVNTGVDELAFLKSVSEDETTGPSARRASGGVQRPLEAMPSSPPAPPAPSAPATGGSEMGRPSTSTGQRTLKCGECGTMNRPTEWYCERCGAELADL